jgi:hypothetical protein
VKTGAGCFGGRLTLGARIPLGSTAGGAGAGDFEVAHLIAATAFLVESRARGPPLAERGTPATDDGVVEVTALLVVSLPDASVAATPDSRAGEIWGVAFATAIASIHLTPVL